jgi:hypothetical protein
VELLHPATIDFEPEAQGSMTWRPIRFTVKRG